MRLIHTALLAGTALGIAAIVAPALGQAVHEMTVTLPDGGHEIIRYTGNVAPKVSFTRNPFYLDGPMPMAFGFDPAFARLDRIAAEMDRQMDAFWHQAWTAGLGSTPGLAQAALGNPGPGVSAWSVTSESFGNHVCSRVTEVTRPAGGGKPQVVTHTSGDCGGAMRSTLTAPASAATPDIQTIADHRTLPAVAHTAL